jgi:DNA-directed RNA polymerase subunit F
MRILSEIVILIALIALIIGGAYYYYNDSQDKLTKLNKEKSELLIVNESYKETLAYIQRQAELNEKRNKELKTELMKAEEYSDKLIAKLRRHDLTALTMQKPTLIENRVNDATQKIFTDLERITSHTD